MRDQCVCLGLTRGDLLHGWGIVAATDVVLAWLVSRIVFGHGHPAIDFMLLVGEWTLKAAYFMCVHRLNHTGVVDDLFVSVIIAFYYPGTPPLIV